MMFQHSGFLPLGADLSCVVYFEILCDNTRPFLHNIRSAADNWLLELCPLYMKILCSSYCGGSVNVSDCGDTPPSLV